MFLQYLLYIKIKQMSRKYEKTLLILLHIKVIENQGNDK